MAEYPRQAGTVDGQVPPSDEPATALPPRAAQMSIRQFVTLQAEAILAHDFTLDLASVTRTGQVDPGSDFFSIMDLAQDGYKRRAATASGAAG
ncbi:uncharacterized protein J4E79_002268 [Alternaria viburni]|uniref:uncharacterized protein n=1 Tax=Alternaria viburni TaxID=566460 RepID=UPI0020C5791A|nr:uncharacterized protein J4E79_002268 [Alternaria viburni]KAI4666231.1 hypothetical protein J4E79_002268 [Alternaria viburni]